MVDGIINVNKCAGMTSHDVVAAVRKMLHMKKVGHAGTLDPQATGVLPILVGKGTKIAQYLSEYDKQYKTVLKLGITTDTQDATGQALDVRAVSVAYADISEAIALFEGDIMQTPPMYSALKINGQTLYKLARQGIELERAPRAIKVDSIKIIGYSEEDNEVELLVDCSKGTYIRTLCHDIGESLGCGGHMKSLIRTRVGPLSINNAATLERLSEAKLGEAGLDEALSEHITSIEDILVGFKRVTFNNDYKRAVLNGNKLDALRIEGNERLMPGEKTLVYCDGTLAGIYEMVMADTQHKLLKPITML